MSAAEQARPIDILRGFDARARKLQRPSRANAVRSWQGMTVRVGELELLIPASEITEVMPAPPVTRVPGTADWFAGLCNLRGQVLPLTDLDRFLFGVRGFRGADQRVLVHGRGEAVVGFRVGELCGLRRFTSELEPVGAQVPAPLQPFVTGSAVQGEQIWPVLSLAAIAASDAFLNIGADA